MENFGMGLELINARQADSTFGQRNDHD